MNLSDILEKLQSAGSEQTKKTLMKHGAKEPLFGVKVEDLKKILKGNKGDNSLAKELFATGIYDAMYLAGLMADGSKMDKQSIDGWARTANSAGISEYTVPWVASENRSGFDLALQWIDDQDENVVSTGWATLSAILSVWSDQDLDTGKIKELLLRAEQSIHQAANRVRYTMNGFIIAAGCFVPSLVQFSIQVAGRIGTVTVDMHGTACKVPAAADYIIKVNKMGRTGQKKKTAKC